MILTGLKINVVGKTRKTKAAVRVSNKLIYGTVIKDGEVYKVSIDKDENGEKEEILDFTPESFNIEGRSIVFLKKKDSNRTVRVIRDEWKAKFHPGDTEKYIPFAEKWIVKGYVVKQGFINLFDFKELVSLKGYEIYDK